MQHCVNLMLRCGTVYVQRKSKDGSHAMRKAEPAPVFFSDEDGPEASLISRRQLHDELLSRLRDYIIAGELKSGAKIPEKELCERFSVSRTPLREALKVLAYEGLVVLNHNRGAIVKPLTLEDLSEAFPIYGRLEALAGELACQRLGQDEIDELRRLQDKLVAYHARSDLKGFTSANEAFHERIQAASQNRNLVAVMRSVSSRVRRARLSVPIPESRLAEALIEHEDIMVAFEQRDGALLSRAIRDHIENTFQFFKNVMAPQDTHLTVPRGKASIGAAGTV